MNRWVVFGILAGLAGSGCRHASSRSDLREYPLYSEAIRLLQDTRPFVYRLNGSRRYVNCQVRENHSTALPGVYCTNPVDRKTLKAAATLAGKARFALKTQGSLDALWTVALLDLVTTDSRTDNLDRVLTRLREVIAHDTANTAALNDVTIAYARRAELRGTGSDLFLSLESAQSAMERQAPSALVLFNLALALEHVSFVGGAANLYGQALKSEATDLWKEELGRRSEMVLRMAATSSSRETLAGPSADGAVAAIKRLARADAEGVRLFVSDDLLPRWAELVVSDRGMEADSVLRVARAIAQELALETGDSTSLAGVDAVERVHAERPALALAVRAFGAGSGAFRTGDYTRAGAYLDDAVRRYDALGSWASGSAALTEWARLLLGSTRIYAGDYSGASAIHRTTSARLAGVAFPSLRGRAHWGVAIGAIRQNLLAVAVSSLTAASDDFRLARESSSLGAVQGLLVDSYYLAGQTSLALAHALRAQRALRFHRSSPYLHNSLVSLGIILAESGLPVAGNLALREAVAVARRTGRAKDPVEAFARLAHSEARLGRVALSAQSLDSAEGGIDLVADPPTRERVRSDIAGARGHLLLRTQPESSVVLLNGVVQSYQRLGFVANLPPALKNRARARLLLADTAHALEDLRRALSVVERASVPSLLPATEASLRATRGELYDQLIAIAVDQGDTDEAFYLAEEARQVSRKVARSPFEPQRAAPAHIILSYYVLEDATALWVIGPTGRRLVMLPTGRRELSDRIGRFAAMIRHTTDELLLDELAGQLYQNLLAPIAHLFTGVDEVWIAAQGSLHQLSFAMLRKDRGTPFLAEQLRIRYLSSATHVPTVVTFGSLPRLLAVDGSGFDRTSYPGLPMLGAAREEARAVAALYAGAAVLEGERAGRSSLIRELVGIEALHFAGHGRSIRGSSALSFLLLNGPNDERRENTLTGVDLTRLDLRHLRLVVLSSCGSDAAVTEATGGENGIAQAFLAAGAGAVVSSLWEADDQGTASLIVGFHSRMLRGVEAAEALRGAQIDMLRGSPTPYARARVWGAFRLEHRGQSSTEYNH